MGDLTLAWLIALFGVSAGALYFRNAARRVADMDYRKRWLRIIQAGCCLYLGSAYIGIALGLFSDLSQVSLFVRPALVVLLAAALGYAIVEY